MRYLLAWFMAGIGSAMLTVLAFLPATWLAVAIDVLSEHRLTLVNAQGTLWQGSASIAANGEQPVILLPGTFSWKVSPWLLLGQVDAELSNPAALSQPIHITGSWSQWQISPATLLISAQYLSALGAPLNTIQPSGQMELSWLQGLLLQRQQNIISVEGTMRLVLNDLASRLSPIKPLGSYNLDMRWNAQQVQLHLSTIRGAMLLEGSGMLNRGHLQFSGTAQAATGQEEKLANFLNLLGQRRQQGGHEVIALEFK
jgi:general secretion pathway protein N